MDAYSNWLELASISNKSADEVILKLKIIFSKFGSPDTMVCDNIPFNSYSFKLFANEWNFNIVTRSPNYPRSNGLAEKAVGIAKSLIKKTCKKGKDIFDALLQYRNSPLKHVNYSPSQLLFSRRCKTRLPTCVDLLKPKICSNVHDKLKFRQDYNKMYYNRNAVDLEELPPDQNVTIFNHVTNQWEPGRVLNRHSSPRSYNVVDKSGNVVRRNRLKP